MSSSTLVPVYHYAGRPHDSISLINHAHCTLGMVICFYTSVAW